MSKKKATKSRPETSGPLQLTITQQEDLKRVNQYITFMTDFFDMLAKTVTPDGDVLQPDSCRQLAHMADDAWCQLDRAVSGETDDVGGAR